MSWVFDGIESTQGNYNSIMLCCASCLPEVLSLAFVDGSRVTYDVNTQIVIVSSPVYMRSYKWLESS